MQQSPQPQLSREVLASHSPWKYPDQPFQRSGLHGQQPEHGSGEVAGLDGRQWVSSGWVAVAVEAACIQKRWGTTFTLKPAGLASFASTIPTEVKKKQALRGKRPEIRSEPSSSPPLLNAACRDGARPRILLLTARDVLHVLIEVAIAMRHPWRGKVIVRSVLRDMENLQCVLVNAPARKASHPRLVPAGAFQSITKTLAVLGFSRRSCLVLLPTAATYNNLLPALRLPPCPHHRHRLPYCCSCCRRLPSQ